MTRKTTTFADDTYYPGGSAPPSTVGGGGGGAPCCGAGGWLWSKEDGGAGSNGRPRPPSEFVKESKLTPPEASREAKDKSIWRKMMSSKKIMAYGADGEWSRTSTSTRAENSHVHFAGEDGSTNSAAVEQLRAENPDSNYYTILAWWYASESSARAREAEKASNLNEAARAARRARASAGKVAALLDQPELTRDHDPADVKAIEALALTAAVDAETADRHAIRWANPQSSSVDDIIKAPSRRTYFYGGGGGNNDLVLKDPKRTTTRKDAKALREDATRLALKTRNQLDRVMKTNDPNLADRLAAEMRATARLFHDLLAAAGTRELDLRIFLVSCALRATCDATKAERYVQTRFKISHNDNDYVTVYATGEESSKVMARVLNSRAGNGDKKGGSKHQVESKMPLRIKNLPRRPRSRIFWAAYTALATRVQTIIYNVNLLVDRADQAFVSAISLKHATKAKSVAAKAAKGFGAFSLFILVALCLTFPCMPRYQLASQRVVGWNVVAKSGLQLEFDAAVSKTGILPYSISGSTFTVDRVSHKALGAHKAHGTVDYFSSLDETAVVSVAVPYRLDAIEHGISAGFNAVLDRYGRGPDVAFDLDLNGNLKVLSVFPLPVNMRCKNVIKLSRPVPQIESADCTYTLFPQVPILNRIAYRKDKWETTA